MEAQSGFKVGDRVRTTRDAAHYVSIPAGTTGTVTYASSVSHATANGGGYDVTIRLDDESIARAINAQLLELAVSSPSASYYSPAFIARRAGVATFRSTELAKEA